MTHKDLMKAKVQAREFHERAHLRATALVVEELMKQNARDADAILDDPVFTSAIQLGISCGMRGFMREMLERD